MCASLSTAFNAIFFLSITTTLTVLFVVFLPLYFLLWQKAYWWYLLEYVKSSISVNLVYFFPRRHISPVHEIQIRYLNFLLELNASRQWKFKRGLILHNMYMILFLAVWLVLDFPWLCADRTARTPSAWRRGPSGGTCPARGRPRRESRPAVTRHLNTRTRRWSALSSTGLCWLLTSGHLVVSWDLRWWQTSGLWCSCTVAHQDSSHRTSARRTLWRSHTSLSCASTGFENTWSPKHSVTCIFNFVGPPSPRIKRSPPWTLVCRPRKKRLSSAIPSVLSLIIQV